LLLLVVFSLQAVAPGVSGRFLLCIGCEGAGFAVASASFLLPPMAGEPCCDGQEELGQEQARWSAECGGVCIVLDRVEVQIQLGSAAPELSGKVVPLAAFEAGDPAALTVCGLGQG